MKLHGEQRCLWRAVDQDGEVVDVFLEKRRDGKAAKRFLSDYRINTKANIER
ncbi:MAG: putative transposase [Pseudohongiellaceae bacterium]